MTRNVTIAITRFQEPDELVGRAIDHALAQTGVGGEVLFIEQQADAAIRRQATGALAFRVVRSDPIGLSRIRNLALQEARYPHVLYLDADALAEPEWAARIAEVLNRPGVAVAGSRIEPGWEHRPPWFTRSAVLRDQYSLLDLGRQSFPYPRVVGAAFGVDRDELPPGFGFDPRLGRREGRLFSGEESQFCREVTRAGKEIFYVGDVHVTHLVGRERLNLRWILRRMFYAGHSRAMLGGAPSPSGGRRALWDWLLLPVYLPAYAMGWTKAKLKG